MFVNLTRVNILIRDWYFWLCTPALAFLSPPSASAFLPSSFSSAFAWLGAYIPFSLHIQVCPLRLDGEFGRPALDTNML
jgi:hypothetical protein